jgi:mRNA interferase YafQ
MRTIERTGRFKRDYKRETKGRHRSPLHESLVNVPRLLVEDQPLPERYRDHALPGIAPGSAIATSNPTLF